MAWPNVKAKVPFEGDPCITHVLILSEGSRLTQRAVRGAVASFPITTAPSVQMLLCVCVCVGVGVGVGVCAGVSQHPSDAALELEGPLICTCFVGGTLSGSTRSEYVVFSLSSGN